MLPPSTMEKTCIAINELAKEAGVKKVSTLVGFGGKAPCWTAAFVNGSLTHPLDYDDSVDAGSQPLHHPTVSTLPAALAVAEKVEEWRYHYNRERPHESLGNVPPVEFAGVQVAK